jgi:hypothetical protein
VQTLTERMQARVGNASSAEAGESSSASVDQDSPVIEWRCAQRFQNSELHPVSSGRGAASIQYTKCSKRSSLNFERPASKPQCVMYRRGPKWMPPAPTTPEMKQITSGKTIPQWPRRWPPWDWFPRCSPPEWIVVATSILASKIVESGLDAMCEVWHESLDLKAKGQPGRASEDSK